MTDSKPLLSAPNPFFLLSLCAFCVTTCKSKPPEETGTASTGDSDHSSSTDIPTILTADVSGDVRLHLAAINAEINVAFMGDARFGLSIRLPRLTQGQNKCIALSMAMGEQRRTLLSEATDYFREGTYRTHLRKPWQ